MKGRLLLDIIVGKSTSILQLLPCKDKTLLIRWDSLLVLNLGLYVINGVRWLDIQSDGLTSKSFHENLKINSEKGAGELGAEEVKEKSNVTREGRKCDVSWSHGVIKTTAI